MSTITKERLEQLENFRGAPVTRQEEQELARIALASLEAEAVSVFKIDHESSLIKHVKKVVSETNAPPAPVAVPDDSAITQHFDTIALETAREIMCDVSRRHEFLGGEVQLLSRIQCRIDDACRAAMLQGADGNSPVIPDGWKVVPVEPTMSQEFAGYRTLTDTGKMSRLMKTRLSNIYRAMIVAAPQQEVK
ncbi:hypothetical protein [Enterobacter kobei]|uniref:hypothetical protein n=1 Tax=Enterobacter kobei TaxID=208224 RepID=UPI002003EB0A|nr:hypothetical protein [Enterobacter kobei]MCK7109454.1 hypothetical protein [Enterobacter kobei]